MERPPSLPRWTSHALRDHIGGNPSSGFPGQAPSSAHLRGPCRVPEVLMHRLSVKAALLASSLLLTPMTMTAHAETATLPAGSPFAAASPLPYAAPQFDKIKDTDYQPAIEAGMALDTADNDAIANDPAAPTFDNTIVALEKAGRLLADANLLFQGVLQSNSSDVLQKVNNEEAPRLQAHTDDILLNPKLFA